MGAAATGAGGCEAAAGASAGVGAGAGAFGAAGGVGGGGAAALGAALGGGEADPLRGMFLNCLCGCLNEILFTDQL